MVTIFSSVKSKFTTIQVSPNLKFRIFENEEDYNITRLILDGTALVRKNYIIIPKSIAKDIAKVLEGGTTR